MLSTSARARWALVGLAGALSVFALVLLISAQLTRLPRELSRLPADERRALYERTLETLRTSCGQSPGPALADYCRQQADFVERFPECDGACRTLAERFHHTPSR